MTVPTISAVIPSLGHSGGATLIEIDGSGFALPASPPSTGPTVGPPPSVTVTVGGAPATKVLVVSPSLIYCLTPKGDPDAGPRDVVVQNNDATGAPVGGEVVTAAAAFSFQRPDLTEESELTRVVRAFIKELKLQVHPNVSWATHTDYDADTGDQLNLASVASLPALVLTNVEISTDLDNQTSDFDEVQIPGGLFISRRPPVVVDVRVTLVGVTDNPLTILNLMQAMRLFFKKTPWLVLDRDSADPSKGTVRYELEWTFGGPVTVSHQGDNSNVESFGGTVEVRGVLLEDIPGISRAKPAAIPGATFPHEATAGIGGVTADTGVPVAVVQEK